MSQPHNKRLKGDGLSGASGALLASAMQTREELREYIAEQAMDPARVLVPEDGEKYGF